MQAHRPPCRPERKRQLLLFLLFGGIVFTLSGQDFVLPDLILSKLSRPDIPQPGNYSDASQYWNPILPSYRRLYPVSETAIPDAGLIIPGKYPAGEENLHPVIPEYSSGLYQSIPSQYQRVKAGTDVDIREGVDAELIFVIPDFGNLGGIFFYPFPVSSPRPVSGEINWSRIGMFSGDIRLGLKDAGGVEPYSTGHINWNGGILRPDSYSLDFYAYGTETPGVSVEAGSRFQYSFEDSEWMLLSEITGGGWYSPEDSSGFIETALAAGFSWPNVKITIKAGADVSYSEVSGFGGAPFLSFLWLPERDFSIFADSHLQTGLPASVDTVFRREELKGFHPGIPISTVFRIGLKRGAEEGLFYGLDVSYCYGTYGLALDGYITSVEDQRVFGTASFGYGDGLKRIELSGVWDGSFNGYPNLWEVQFEYAVQKFALYITGGTEDAILAGYLPGIRGEQPIIGTGVVWTLSKSWKIDTFTYTEIPWKNPSLRFSLDWRN